MASDGSHSDASIFTAARRNDSTLVTPWPPPFDTKHDILIPAKADNFVRMLEAALHTRGLLKPLQERVPSKTEILMQNPEANADQVQECFDKMQSDRATILMSAAANLPNVVKISSMTILEQSEFNSLARAYDAEGMYELIRSYAELKSGKAQDKIRETYPEVAVRPTDSMETIIQKVDIKYYLWTKTCCSTTYKRR